MKRITLLTIFGALLAAVVQGADKPNIIFILADDLGYGDVNCFHPESTIPTPHLDLLAAEGMMFTDAHSGSAVCTPTRYGVITGRYSWRTETLKRGVLSGYSPPLISQERLTVGKMLQQQRYKTACIGKWHLGLDWTMKDGDDPKNPDVDWSLPLKHGPTGRGFDMFFGISASLDMPPYCYIVGNRVTNPPTVPIEASDFPKFWRKGPRSEDFVFVDVLDRLAVEADRFIAAQASRKVPFFLYMPLPAPHKPVVESEAFRGKSGLGPYGDFVMQVDSIVGKVVESVDRSGIAENTLLMVTSDNGSFMYHRPDEAEDHVGDHSLQWYKERRSNGPFRGTKADIWEGGHRVPFIARWPAVVAAGSKCDETICHVDLMATCAEVVGVRDLPRNAAEDSFSILPLLKTGKWGKRHRAPVVHHSANGMFAIRDGKWKLVFGSGSGGREHPGGKRWEHPYHLFDMAADPAETTNVVGQHPEVVGRLTSVMLQMMADGRSR